MNEAESFPIRSEKEIFVEALDKNTPQERAAFLDGACGKNTARRDRVEALLAGHFQEDAFMKQPAAAREEPIKTIKLGAVVNPNDEAVGQTIGRYKLLEKLGEGGCGAVYVAQQNEPVRRRVALKVIKLGMDTKEVIARFEAERQALAMMDHPNIAKVFDAGTTETGRPYFVMELVRGIKITEYCDQNQLNTTERLSLLIEVCHAVQHAHQKGIIHRDIKPSNIMVTLHDGVAVPKVIDFGIAKATEGRLTAETVYTQLHQFIGTPAYMSPEQAEMSGLDIDTRSDIYSLGVLLYELLAGSTPFDAKELMASGLDAMRKIIREKEPVRPSTRFATLQGADLTTTAKRRSTDTSKLLHQLRGDLDWIVMKCLEKDRTRRYETANGLAMDIQRYLGNELVLARPPSAAYRLQKAWRRNKLVFTAAALIAATLMVGIAISSWQAIEARRARNAEKKQLLAAQAAQQSEKQQRQLAEGREAEVSRLLYVANMNVAQQAWDQNNIGRLRQTLEDTKDSPYRGFEWYYWQPQTHMALMTLRGHLGPVSSVAVSPDGRRIATGSMDTTAKIWDAASGRELLTLEGHRDWIVCVAFSRDGRRIVTASHDQTARVWDADTGRELFTLKGHSDVVRSALFSPDGRRIVTGKKTFTQQETEDIENRLSNLYKDCHRGYRVPYVEAPGNHDVTPANKLLSGSSIHWHPISVSRYESHFGQRSWSFRMGDFYVLMHDWSEHNLKTWAAEDYDAAQHDPTITYRIVGQHFNTDQAIVPAACDLMLVGHGHTTATLASAPYYIYEDGPSFKYGTTGFFNFRRNPKGWTCDQTVAPRDVAKDVWPLFTDNGVVKKVRSDRADSMNVSATSITITNDLPENFYDGRVRFVLPKGRYRKVTNGIVLSQYDCLDGMKTAVLVKVNIPATNSITVTVPDGLHRLAGSRS